MSEPIKTERYRLALIAHHAERLAELLHGGENYGISFIGIAHRFGISADVIAAIASYINEYLNKEETK